MNMTTEVVGSDAREDSSHGTLGRPAIHRRVYEGLSGLIGAVVGLAPHVLHHLGFLVGTALVAGSGGTALFAALGAVAALPLLLATASAAQELACASDRGRDLRRNVRPFDGCDRAVGQRRLWRKWASATVADCAPPGSSLK